jgi:CHC2 zinc finger
MNVNAIVERVKGVRHSGAGWIGRCPAHEDRSPSLSIREGEGGRILMHCFAGCTVTAVCEALNLKVCDLFSEPGAAQPKPRAVREAEKQIQNLRSRLTRREQALPVSVVYINSENLEAGIARALALAVEGEIVQVVLEGER